MHTIEHNIYIYKDIYYDPCCILLFQVDIANNSAPIFHFVFQGFAEVRDPKLIQPFSCLNREKSEKQAR